MDWTASEEACLRKHYPRTLSRELAKRMGRTFGSVNGKAARMRLKKDAEFAGTFKKGSIPPDVCPVGGTRINQQGYVLIKAEEGKGKWRVLHRENWKKEHGDYPPKGMRISFKDGNRANCEIGNLELISMAEVMQKNSLNNMPAEIQELIRIKGVINLLINRSNENELS